MIFSMPAPLSTLTERFGQSSNLIIKRPDPSIETAATSDETSSARRRLHRRTHAVQLSRSDIEQLELRRPKRSHRHLFSQAALPPFQFPWLYIRSRDSSPVGGSHSRSSSESSTASLDSISSVDSVETTITEPECEPIQQYCIADSSDSDTKHDSFFAESPSDLYPTHLRKISVEQVDLIEDLAYQLEVVKIDERSQTRPIIVIS